MAEALIDHEGGATVKGFLHRVSDLSAHPMGQKPVASGFLVLTHGAGGNSEAPLLVALADAFAASGLTTLRCDLPFRQRRPTGPPSPSDAKRDQQGLRRAVTLMREKFAGPAFLGGASYGGRQASMLLAEEPSLVEGLLLLSYPLHPPGRPAQLRTAHLSSLQTPTLFISGTRDPFGSVEELTAAIKLIPAPAKLVSIEGAGHGLLQNSNCETLPGKIVQEFQSFFRRR
ncbi:MAG TPA: alpha/beta family hydrolase [Terriglobales bacterium]|nr:alpha/beta family hydrolase [Terriglobales bacterium]